MKFKSALVTQVSGSVGGMTGAHNQGGMYFRARSLPTQPNTARQQQVKATVAGLSDQWNNTLSEVQREGWRTYATATPIMGKMGEPVILSGQQMFIRCNSIRGQITARTAGFATPVVQPLVLTAPATSGVAVAASDVVTFTRTTNALAIDVTFGGPAIDDGDAVLQVGNVVSAGRSFYKGPWQLAAVTSFDETYAVATFTVTDATDPEDWWADNPVPVDAIVPWRFRVLYDDGKIGPYAMGFAVVVAGA